MPPSCGCLLFDLFITYDNFCVLFVGVIDFRTSKKRINTQVISYCAIQFCVTSNPHYTSVGMTRVLREASRHTMYLYFTKETDQEALGRSFWCIPPQSIMYASSVYPTTIFFTRVYLTTKSCWDPHGVRPKEMDDHMPWMHGGGSQPMDHIERWIPRGHASMRSQIRMVATHLSLNLINVNPN